MAFFSGKLAYITGGSSGIGLETARLLVSEGCSLVLFARKQAGLDKARQALEARIIGKNQRIDTVSMDVADNDDVQQKIKTAVTEYGVPDILINSAGIGTADYFENISYEAFDRVMKINVYGTRNTIAALLPYMRSCGRGHIVNLSSEAGLIGMFGYSLYSTSKYALVGLSECLRSELKRMNIDVTVVCPPEVDTPFVAEEAPTLPPEARAVKSMAGLLKPEYVAKTIVKALKKKKFLVVPGLMARYLYFNHRISNGHLTHFFSDLIVRFAAHKRGPRGQGGEGARG